MTIPSYRVLGVRIHAVQISEAVKLLREWSSDRSRTRTIVVANAHVVNEARRDPAFRRVLEEADLCVADGTPLMLMGRLTGHSMPRRVYGPELMMTALKESGLKHFFYGGREGVADELARRLRASIPGVQIVGTYSTPIAPLAPYEPSEVVDRIHASGADIVWVGLGAPKQELWMHLRRKQLRIPALVGVGAAFDFHAGHVAHAPYWMREHGLEWLFRLGTEPRRLWRRYLIQGGEFAFALVTEIFTGRYRRISS